MSQTDVRIESALHRDVYPIVRVSTEFFLRGVDLFGELQDDDTIGGLVVMTLWYDQLVGSRRKPMSIRELARKLDLPYETVRRHVRQLELSGACIVDNGKLTVSSTMQRKARTTGTLRKIFVNAVRLLGDLTRLEVVNFEARTASSPRSRRMGKDQTIIALAAIGLLLRAMKALRGFFGDDLMKGLVFTAIRAANIKHYTNTSPAAHRSILPDTHRLPVSALAISDSLRLPYETVRRHADILVKEGLCTRVGRRGLVVPESAFRHMTLESVTVHQLILDFVGELRAAGVKV